MLQRHPLLWLQSDLLPQGLITNFFYSLILMISVAVRAPLWGRQRSHGSSTHFSCPSEVLRGFCLVLYDPQGEMGGGQMGEGEVTPLTLLMTGSLFLYLSLSH